MTGLVAARSLICLSSHRRECTVPTPLLRLGSRRSGDPDAGDRCVFVWLRVFVALMPMIAQMVLKARGGSAPWNAKAGKAAEKYFFSFASFVSFAFNCDVR